MDHTHKLRLLAALFSMQDEEGDVFDLPVPRIAAIAAGEAWTAEERTILLASPLARAELALQLRLQDLRAAEAWRECAVNDNFHFVELDAADSASEEFQLRCSAGVIKVERGPNNEVPFLLTLTLDRDFWDDRYADRWVTVTEAGGERLQWMRGRTDKEGVLRTTWQYSAKMGTPAARWEKLRLAGAGSSEEVGRLLIVPA